MQNIPLSAVPNQSLTVVLDNQTCQINVYQKTPMTDEYGVAAGLFFDISVNGSPVRSTVRCMNASPMLADAQYLFDGDFVWTDTQGTDPPYFTGLGTRWMLTYLSPSDLAALDVE
jgi:hypothetical protein